MARLMLSAGMLACFASAMIVRSLGFMSGSPPAARAATVNSLMRRGEIFPRFAAGGPLLVLDGSPLGMTGHGRNSWEINEIGVKILHLFREDDPDIGTLVPGAPPVV